MVSLKSKFQVIGRVVHGLRIHQKKALNLGYILVYRSVNSRTQKAYAPILFNIELSNANLTKLLEPVNLKTYKGGFAFISASNWLKLFEEPIANVEKNF